MSTDNITAAACMAAIVASALACGCSHQESQDSTTAIKSHLMQLGTPCPPLATARDAAGETMHRVFLEIGDLSYVSDEARRSALEHQAVAAEHVAVANGIFTDNQRNSVPWICGQKSGCGFDSQAAPDCKLSLVPIMPARPGEPIRLAGIELHPATQEPSGEGAQVEVHDQQTTLVELRAENGCPIRVAITPYIVASEKDAAVYSSCKQNAQSSHAKASQP